MAERSPQSLPDGRRPGRWYVVQTLAYCEKRADFQLVRQGFWTFLPMHQKTVRHARQFRTVQAPFFPRYLFVHLDLERQRWRSVNGTFGVASLIMDGERPRAVPAGVVEGIAATADSFGLISLTPQLAPGDPVRIVRGPLAGLVGTLAALDDKQRVKVLLDVLGKDTLVAIDAAGVGLVPANRSAAS